MLDALWSLLWWSVGMAMGAGAMRLAFLRGYGNAYIEGYQVGKAHGHAEGFAQGRQVSEQASR